MNIAKINKIFHCYFKRVITNKNFKKYFNTFLLLLCLCLLSFFVIHNYCDYFYKFSDDAKSRILFNKYQVYYLTPLLFWLSSYLHKKYAFNPYGTGLDNITFALKKLEKYPNSYKKVSNFVSLKIAFIVIASSLISTFAGGSLGREAPSILVAVCICFACANYFKNHIVNFSLDVWAYVGYTIGMAIAFNAPIAGAVYLIEKLLKNRCKNYVSATILSIIALLLICILLYKYEPVYFVKNFRGFNNYHFLHYIAVSLFCCITAFLLLKICRYYYIKFIAIKSWKWHLIPIFFGILVGFIGIYYGIFAIGGGIRAVNEAFLSDYSIHNKSEFVGRYLSTMFTYIAGNFGGIVAPSLALGNIVGSVYAQLFSNVDASALMLIGMVAFLAPVLSVPLTSAFVVLESTSIAFDNIYVLVAVSLLSFSLTIIFQKIGAKIRAKLYQPKTN